MYEGAKESRVWSGIRQSVRINFRAEYVEIFAPRILEKSTEVSRRCRVVFVKVKVYILDDKKTRVNLESIFEYIN